MGIEKQVSKVRIFVMNKFMYNRDFPYPARGVNGVTKPYHFSIYTICLAQDESSNPIDSIDFFTFDELARFFKRLKPEYEILAKQHNLFNEVRRVDGEDDDYGVISQDDCEKLRKIGLPIY
ncbi:hypothetical protein HY448_01265 [Candidatus Pacearchaeota archaeon]|nr:hypothetical protein [Candidatus Pacearchaeota archaeon]